MFDPITAPVSPLQIRVQAEPQAGQAAEQEERGSGGEVAALRAELVQLRGEVAELRAVLERLQRPADPDQ